MGTVSAVSASWGGTSPRYRWIPPLLQSKERWCRGPRRPKWARISPWLNENWSLITLWFCLVFGSCDCFWWSDAVVTKVVGCFLLLLWSYIAWQFRVLGSVRLKDVFWHILEHYGRIHRTVNGDSQAPRYCTISSNYEIAYSTMDKSCITGLNWSLYRFDSTMLNLPDDIGQYTMRVFRIACRQSWDFIWCWYPSWSYLSFEIFNRYCCRLAKINSQDC